MNWDNVKKILSLAAALIGAIFVAEEIKNRVDDLTSTSKQNSSNEGDE